MKKDQLIFGAIGGLLFLLFQIGNPVTFFFGGAQEVDSSTTSDPYRERIMSFCPERYEHFSTILREAQKNEASGEAYPFDTYAKSSVELYQRLATHFINEGICPERLPAADAPDGEKRLLAENVEKVKRLCPGAVEDFGHILENQIDGLYSKESAILFFDIVKSYHLNGYCLKSSSNGKEKQDNKKESQIITPKVEEKETVYDEVKIKEAQKELLKKEEERLLKEEARKKAQEAFNRANQPE